jgi:hypothetical protein
MQAMFQNLPQKVKNLKQDDDFTQGLIPHPRGAAGIRCAPPAILHRTRDP